MIRKTTRRCAPMVAAAQPAIVKTGRRRGPKQIRQAAARQWLHAMAVSLLVMATVSLGFSAPARADTAATAAQVNILQTRGQFAYAQYVQYTDNYCEGLSVEVFAGSDLSRVNRTRTGQPSVFVFIVNFNTCTGVYSTMYGSSTDVALKFAPDLSPVDAAGTVIVTDGTDSRTVKFALHWEGGTLTSTKSKSVTTSPSLTVTFQQMDSFRTNMLVSGSLMLDGVELLSPANVVDFSAVLGFAYNSKGSTIVIERNF